ncbi:hypothetical protein HMPREF1568_2898 [Providencia alcalifaciens PAL-3]|nr:hypothetical protein HMPREF1568_2898 [Providencia alcalifaciens PAL-3]
MFFDNGFIKTTQYVTQMRQTIHPKAISNQFLFIHPMRYI